MDYNLDPVKLFVLNFYGPMLTGILILFIFIWWYIVKYRSSLRKNPFKDQHVVITGGSSGIGKSFAFLMAKKGANVTIIARDPVKLKHAKDEISKLCVSSLQRVIALSVDVSKDAEVVAKAIADAEEGSGPVYMLVNCAGAAICGKIEDTSIEDFKYMMDLNYFGTVYPTKAVITGMKERRGGHIVMVSSQAGMIGIFGFSAYSSAKFALRGLAEALDMEVREYGIRVTVCLPPDTDTPGFELENLNKPLETKLISSSPSGPESPDYVAEQLLKDVIAGKFFSSVGLEGFFVMTGCAGAAPASSLCEIIIQVCLMGLIRFVSLCYLWSFHRIVRKCMRDKDRTKRSD